MTQRNGNGDRKWHDHGFLKLIFVVLAGSGIGIGSVAVKGQNDSSQVVDSLNREMDGRQRQVSKNTDNITGVKEDIARIEANLKNVKEDVESIQEDIKETRDSQIRQELADKVFRKDMTRWMKSMQNGHRDNGNGNP